MKKFLLIVLTLLSVQAFAQTNPITAINITLPSNPDALTANWGTGTSVFMITATAHASYGKVDPVVEESRILVSIKQNGKTVCGAYNSGTAPAADFITVSKVWSGGNAVSLVGKECTLAPGDYELSVQFFGDGAAGPIALSDEQLKPFTIKGNDQQAYQPPQVLSPADGTVFSDADLQKAITFRWVPVIPKPQQPVTYHLRVWQLMTGQSGARAIISNQPIIIKDIDNLTQAVVTNLITGPCKPPYLCDFVWNVQALGRDGKPIGGNNGTSGPATFRKEGTIVPFDTLGFHITLVSPEQGFAFTAGELPVFTWKADTKLPAGSYYRLTIIKLPGTASPQAIGNKPFFEKDTFKSVAKKILPNPGTGSPQEIGNKPFFEKDTIQPSILKYPSSAPKLVPGVKYAWKVEAVARGGKTIGASDANGFMTTGTDGNTNGTERSAMDSYGVTVQNLVVACTKTTSYNFTINVGNPNNSTAIFDKLEIVSINGAVLSTPIPTISVSPAIGSTIPANGNINVSAAFNYGSTLNIVCVKAYIKQQSNPTMNTAGSYECDTLKCCWPCDMNQVTVSNSSVVVTDAVNGVIQVHNTISATPNNITKIQADLVYVKISPVNDNCNQCNKQPKEQDNFIGLNTIANGSQWKNNGNGAIAFSSANSITRSLTFTSNNASGVNISQGIQITHTIGLPPNSCCGDVVEVWIRYSVWDTGCHVCSQLIKATVTRNSTCATGGTNGTNGIIDHH